jgi:hypothetical protein
MNGGLFGSGILDVAIGLVLVYLVLSIMASALSEMINSALNSRTQGLELFIRSLFMRPELAEKYVIGAQRAVMRMMGRYEVQANPAERYVDHFYEQTLIAPTAYGDRRPAYITARDFALAIFDTVFRVPTDAEMKVHLLTPGNTPPYDPNTDTSQKLDYAGLDIKAWKDAIYRLPANAPLKPVMLSLLTKADNDIDAFRRSFENWFDSAMERVGGWYKKRTQLIIVVIGLTVAAVFNIDTIAIANKLLQNPALRSAVAEQATLEVDRLRQIQAQQGDTSQDPAVRASNMANQAVALDQILASLNIPIGWSADVLRPYYEAADPNQPRSPLIILGLILQKLLGIFITGFAVSQGAPFWFDMLNRLTNLRSVGKAPQQANNPEPGAVQPADPASPTAAANTPAATTPKG